MTENSLQILNLLNAADCKKYDYYLNLVDSSNPFYKIELFLKDNQPKQKLKYFLYSVNEEPKIIMLFHLREIMINDKKSGYHDVASPYGYSGPLLSNTVTDEDVKGFWESVDMWYKEQNIISEFVRFSLNDNKRFYTGQLVATLKNVKGKIVDERTQWERFDKKVRNNFRKALKHNLKFKICSEKIGNEDLVAFYDIYISTMIRRNATNELYYSLDYFKYYTENNINNCALAIVYQDEKPISTEFLLLSNNSIYSYLGGTLSSYFSSRPNDFLKVNVLNWGRDKNFDYYVLGGGRENNDRLYAYKKSFFPKDTDAIFYTGRKVMNTSIYNELVEKKANENKLQKYSTLETREDYFPAYRNENVTS